LLTKSVYPSQNEMLEATEEYLFNQHEVYFSQFNKESWTLTYERYYYRTVSLVKFVLLFTESYEILRIYLQNFMKYYAYIYGILRNITRILSKFKS
jgi:hypothetical protein